MSNITVNPPDRGGPPDLKHGNVVVTIGSGITEVDFTDTSTQACGGQSLITIDQSHGVAYAPIYTPDANGDAQIEVVDLSNLSFVTLISLPGAQRPISATYNPNSNPPTMLVEAVLKTGGPIGVFVVNTNNYSVSGPVVATGLNYNGSWGGILEDSSAHNRAFVAGSYNIGILDQSSGTFGNVVTLPNNGNTDSLSLNVATDTIFISGDGINQVIQAVTAPPLNPIPFIGANYGYFGTTDGNAFDPFTNTLLLSQEVGADQSWGFNFNTLNTTTNPASALYVQVPGVCPNGTSSCATALHPHGCEMIPTGEGPGGQTAINCTTHQGLIVDEFGQNLKLIQLPTTSVGTSPLDNNGRYGSGTLADAASVYTIAEAVIPMGLVNGNPTQLGVVGDPNSVVIDNVNNVAYMLADTEPYYHPWAENSGLPLFLVKVDLSSPSFGACPSGLTGVSWTPATTAFRLK